MQKQRAKFWHIRSKFEFISNNKCAKTQRYSIVDYYRGCNPSQMFALCHQNIDKDRYTLRLIE